MGTRADFYIRTNPINEPKPILEWLGSVAYDGYPEEFDDNAGILAMTASDPSEFRAAVSELLSKRDDATLPDRGWPWPWEDSLLTDFAYVFENGQVKIFNFGRPFDPSKNDDETNQNTPKAKGYFPDMSACKNVRFDKGSGVIFLGI